MWEKIGFVRVNYALKFKKIEKYVKNSKIKKSQNPGLMSNNIIRGIPIPKIRRLNGERGFRIEKKK